VENFHATPEGNMIFDRFSRALPVTGGVGVAWSKIFPLDRIRRKIVIALYDNSLIDSAMIVSSQVAFMKPSL
jgi:hypothetical protein